jgi:hypothetical protein
MKYKTFIQSCALAIVISLLTEACNSNSNGTQQVATKIVQPNYKRIYYIDETRYSIQIVDSCEYIVSSSSTVIAHKGNCSNPIHKNVIYVHDTIYLDFLPHSQIK